MKFNRLIVRITTFWTALALGVIVVSLFSDATVCPFSHNREALEKSAPRSAEKTVDYVSTDDYAVFSAILAQYRSPNTLVVSELVVDANWKDSQYVRSQYFILSDYAVNEYHLKNQELRKLRNEFGLPFQVSLLSLEKEALLFPAGEGGWDGFYRAYPKARGIIYFSGVGFNKNKDEAIVRVKFQSVYSSERNDFYILKKVEGKWLVEKDSGVRAAS